VIDLSCDDKYQRTVSGIIMELHTAQILTLFELASREIFAVSKNVNRCFRSCAVVFFAIPFREILMLDSNVGQSTWSGLLYRRGPKWNST
jgi:hypothetical protein